MQSWIVKTLQQLWPRPKVGPSGSALLLDLTKDGIKKSKNEPLDSCFLLSIFSTATGFGLDLGLGLKLNVGS